MTSKKALRPSKLTPKDTVHLISTSFRFDENLFSQAQDILKNRWSLQIKHTSLTPNSYFAGSDTARLEQLKNAFLDPTSKAILAIRGGYGLSRISPEILSFFRKNKKKLKPKTIVGYSDLTLLLNTVYKELGWVTYHGPVLVGKAFREASKEEQDSFQKCLFSQSFPEIQKLISRVPGTATAPIVGGCLSLIASSLGTDYEVDTSGKILFLEEVDERPYRIDRMLTQLLHAGKLDKIKGLVLGQLELCNAPELSKDPSQTSAIEALEQAILPFLKRKRIPVVYNFPAGHGSPQITFPIGAVANLKVTDRQAALIFKK